MKTFVPLIEKEIKSAIKIHGFPNLYDGMEYAIGTGGKRLRPILCLAICKSLGEDFKKAIPFATAIELVHNFTLIHDDIEDGDHIRRGKPTVWKKYGIAHAINIGDGMIFRAYEELEKSRNILQIEKVLDLIHIFNNSIMKVIEGQNMEFNFRKKDSIKIKEYEEMATKKAGVLFGLSLAGAAIISNADGKIIQSLSKYGEKIGLVFQIRDDILNLKGKEDRYGKEIGGDIKEGKKTLIVIHCLKKCDSIEREGLLNILNKERKNVSSDDIEFSMKLIEKYRSIDFAEKYAEKMFKEANRHIKNIGNKNLMELFEEFSTFVIKRDY